MRTNHAIEFRLRPEVSIGVITQIAESGELFVDMSSTGEVAPVFEIYLDKELAKSFMHQWDWALEECCDLDQKDGGSYI